jgi:hypothetical protein
MLNASYSNMAPSEQAGLSILRCSLIAFELRLVLSPGSKGAIRLSGLGHMSIQDTIYNIYIYIYIQYTCRHILYTICMQTNIQYNTNIQHNTRHALRRRHFRDGGHATLRPFAPQCFPHACVAMASPGHREASAPRISGAPPPLPVRLGLGAGTLSPAGRDTVAGWPGHNRRLAGTTLPACLATTGAGAG